MTDRIVVDPESLRLVASRMRGGAELLFATGRDLAHRHLPAMPPAVTSLVTEALARVNGELQDLSAALVRDAGLLAARATWAELGETDAVWSGGRALGDVSASGGGIIEAGRTESWSVELLEGAEEPLRVADGEDASHLRELVGVPEGSSEPPAGDGLSDMGVAEEGTGADGIFGATGSGRLASGAALGNVFSDTGSGPTGAGILGCIAVGLGTAGTEAPS